MKEGFAVLIFYSFLLPAFGLSYRMFDKHTQGTPGSMYHGRYTRDIHDPELLIPRRVTEDGSFLTFTLPNFYDRQELDARKKRAADANANANTDADADNVNDDLADHRLHLVLPFNGADHHVELTPHHEFISPDMVVETRGEGAITDPNNGIRFKRVPDLQCHYRGRIRGHDNSRAALSLCEGVAGFVQTDQGRYFIEPLEEAVPDEEGQHVHMAYKRHAPHEDSRDNQKGKRSCGTSDDWETAWAEQLEKKNQRERLANNGTFVKRAPVSSNTHSTHRYVELALFCDKRFLDFHKGKNYEQYLLTIMNMASDFYHDVSVGNQMDVVVVRIVYLEKQKDEIDLFISPEAEKTLDSFATWQNKMNPKDHKHPNHHDVGVLITRYDICSNDNGVPSCNLMGLAYVAAACDPPKAACINEDSGLLLGIVITHEVGHTLGSGHDEPAVSGCEPTDTDKSYFVMSPIVSIFTLRWSPCSRKFLTAYLESGMGDCLNDNTKKPNDKYKFPGMLAGAMYDGAYQCDTVFPGSKLCDKGAELCEKLWCATKEAPQSCSSRGPPAEGTKCGENKWCIHHKCVEIGKRPAATHGGWGSWGGMGDCSRTCGGGVRSDERDCDNPKPKDGGRYCLGERKKYSTCNTAPCDEKKPSFRAVQCSEFNSQKVMADGLHQWKPENVPDENPCILFCVNEKNVYVKLAPTVKDGTPCEGGTKNMCIGGVCKKVSCDWGIDSDVVEDQCGICKGDGTQCNIVEGDFTATGKGDYQKIVTVPRGSRNIKLTEKGSSENTLAVKTEKGDKYIINGDHNEVLNGEYPGAGAIAVYNHPEPGKEEITIRGPIDEDIQLQYCFYKPKENPGVHYAYSVRSGKSGAAPQYLWDFLDWGPCSAKCGGGTQLAQASCVEHLSGKVSNSFCKDISRPDPKSRICDSNPCGAKWRVSQWSRCGACGGKKGQQRRKVQCVKPAARPGGEDVQAELGKCRGKVPKQAQECTGSKPCKKKCSKKTRSNVFEDESNAYGDKQPSVEEQQHIIDKLVDSGMTRYLEKPNLEHAEGRSKKRNVGTDFKHLIDDWSAPANEVGLDGKRNCPGGTAKSMAAVPEAGTIIKDAIPSSSIVVEEAPFITGIAQSNMSDQAFQEDGDIIGVEIETDKLKTFKGAEAIKRLQEAHHNDDDEPLPKSTAGG